MADPKAFEEIERAIAATMDEVSAAISRTNEALSRPGAADPLMEERAARMFARARTGLFKTVAAALDASRERMRRSKGAVATTKALIEASEARIGHSLARLEQAGRRPP